MANIIVANRFGAETKKKSVPNLDPDFMLPTAGGSEISAADIAKEPYLFHLWTYASASIYADRLKWLPKIVENKNSGEIKPDADILDVFNNPNPWMRSGATFWEAVILGLMLPSERVDNKPENTGGQVFLVFLDKNGEPVDLSTGAIPNMVFPYTDKCIRARQTENDNGTILEGWDFVDPKTNQTKIKFKTTEVVRINQFNPYDWVSGLSPFVSAQFALVEDVKSDIYNTQSFENDGTVAGVLSTDLDMGDDQYKENMKRWMSKHGGAGNNSKIAILGNGLKYQQYGLSQVDMQFTEQKKGILEKFAAAYKLNKIAYGKYEGINYATIKEGRKLLWQDSYLPVDKLITSAINDQWVRYIDNGKWVFKSDYSGVEALKPDYTIPGKSAQVMVNMGLPASLAFQLNGIPLTEQNLIDFPWLSEQPPSKTAGAAPAPEKSIEPKIKSLIHKNELNDEEKKLISASYIKNILEPMERKWRDAMDKFFNSQRNRMQDKVDDWLKTQKSIPDSIDVSVYLKAYWKQLIIDPAMFLLNPIEENKKLTKVFKPLVVDQLKSETERLKEELGPLISWEVDEDNVDSFIKARQEDIKSINTTTFKKANKKIGVAIEEAIKANDTPQETAKKIKAAISDVATVRKNQAMTIARTETGSISSAARFGAFKAEGIEYTEWLTANDEKVREAHVIAGNAGPIPLGNNFPAVNMRFPLDPRGLAGEIINCRCVSIAARSPRDK